MTACLKQKVVCVIMWWDEKGHQVSVSATNDCAVDGLKVCPSEERGLATGEGYELCGPPIHAEIAAISELFKAGMAGEGATAYLYGHDYFCEKCQKALIEAGVRRFVVTGEVAQDDDAQL